jgi:serine/threonine protein kinase
VGAGGTADTDDFVGTTTPRVWGDYTLRKVLGRGGMGMVWLATRRARGVDDIETPCVVKTLRSSDDPEYERRFIDEARLLVLVAHKNICSVFDAGCVEGQYYLAMEHIDGHDLKKVAAMTGDSGAPLPTGVVLYVVGQVLEALEAAHHMRHPVTKEPLRVVHRDVSPQNVMLAHDGRVKLIDFGLALSTQKVEKTAPSIVMGKLAYMAPEQARGEPIDARADQFAAGVLLYEMLANARYYEGLSVDDTWRKSGAGGHVPERLAGLPEGLRAIVQKATAPRADKRYPSCAAMAEALAQWARDHDEFASPADARVALRELVTSTHFLEAPTGERMKITSLAGRNAVAADVNSAAAGEPLPAPRERTRTFRLRDLDGGSDIASTSGGSLPTLPEGDPAAATARTPAAPTNSPRPEPTLIVRVNRDGAARPTRNGGASDVEQDARRHRRVTIAAIAAGLAVAIVVAGVVLARERTATAVVDADVGPRPSGSPGDKAFVLDAGATDTTGSVVDAGARSASGAVNVDAGAVNVDTGAVNVDAGAVNVDAGVDVSAATARDKQRRAGRTLPPWPDSNVLRQAALLREHCADVPCTGSSLKNLARTDGPARRELERQLRNCYATCKRTAR